MIQDHPKYNRRKKLVILSLTDYYKKKQKLTKITGSDFQSVALPTELGRQLTFISTDKKFF